MRDRGALGRLVVEFSEQLGALARGAAQDGVHETVAAAPVALGELHGVGDHGAVGRAVQVEQLVEPQPQRGQQRRVELCGRPLGEPLDQVVERAAPLHGPVEEAHREGTVAGVQGARLLAQRDLGVGAALEHLAQGRVCRGPRGREAAHARGNR